MMKIQPLIKEQRDVIDLLPGNRVFLEGPAGCGKTTAAVESMLSMMAKGVPGSSLLVLVPQQTLAEPYYDSLKDPGVLAGGMVTVLTIGGLARRMVDLFWPLISEKAGFNSSTRAPEFLTLETAQYYMSRIVKPLLDEGYFSSVVLDRNRLYSQIIDNLNKSALVGFPYTEIYARLSGAWTGEPGQLRIYQDVQDCANRFREFCLGNNLLDFSLQIEVFWKYVWNTTICKRYLMQSYRHIIADNIEEDIPVTHDVLSEWLPEIETGLLIYDRDSGLRAFLGADPRSGYGLRSICSVNRVFDQSFVMSTDVSTLQKSLSDAIMQPGLPFVDYRSKPSVVREEIDSDYESFNIGNVLIRNYHRFYPEMLDWVVEQIRYLISEEGYSPSDIVVLAPYVSDALRFAISYRLGSSDIPYRSHRPSRSLREEPAIRCLLTFADISHPRWGGIPQPSDFAYALLLAIEGLDLVRAQILTEIVYRVKDGEVNLTPFANIKAAMQERITIQTGERYERLRVWLEENKSAGEDEIPFDYYLSRLFGELLSQPGFRFHLDYHKGELTANLIESVRKFRRVVDPTAEFANLSIGSEYTRMLSEGVISAQYLRSWQYQTDPAVLIAPAYTFLMSNRPIAIQFWLDIGSRSWYQRVNQPLTHPYVLSRNWQRNRPWTEKDEAEISAHNLNRLTSGLLKRCKDRLYIGLSHLGEQGYEQRGVLLNVFQRVLREFEG